MPDVLTDEENEPTNVLWYGDGGSGKSTNLAAGAVHGKMWIVNAESGMKGKALRRYAEEAGLDIPLENIELFPGDGEELTYESLEEEWSRIREALHADPEAYWGTGWDSITEIQQHLKDLEMKRGVRRAARRGQDRDPFTMDQDNWRTVNEQCRSLIRKFRDLPCNFGATALQRREQDNDGKVVYMPAVTPGLQNDLIGWMDMVCHTETLIAGGEDNFMGMFRNRGKFRGKDRLHVMPGLLVNPTFPRIKRYLDDDLTVDDDEDMQELKKRMESDAAEETD